MALKEEKSPYHGKIVFGDETIRFTGNTILLRNIAWFGLYNLKRKYQVSDLVLIAAVIAAIGGFMAKPYGLLITAFAAIVIFMGIAERLRNNKLHGISIELNSGYVQHFLSTDAKGITDLFNKLTEKIERNKRQTIIADFSTNHVTVEDRSVNINGDNNVSVGDHSSFAQSN